MIHEDFRVTGARDSVFDCTDLFSITLHGDDIQDFGTSWDQALLSKSESPNDKILESLYKMRIRESDQFQTVMAMYEQEITQDRSRRCQKLKTMVKRQLKTQRKSVSVERKSGVERKRTVIKRRCLQLPLRQ